jgi:hypothetical protein
MAELNITELDFDLIKANLRTYLASQSEFTDYDFTGSALSTLLDVLAYNTHYNAVLANMQANEMFIDTAVKRTSVVSLAKMLGYTPKSTTSSKAKVNVVVVKNVTVGSTLTIDPTVEFTSTINGVTYTFRVNVTDTVTVSGGNFTFQDVELIEGTSLSNQYTVTSDTLSGPFVIPVDNIDTTTITVTVQNSVGDPTSYAYVTSSSVIDVTNTSKIFWVEENYEGKYQIIFGDDIIGKQLTAGNIVTISYLASKGSASNGAQNFTIVGDIAGETGITVTTVTAAAGGSEKETIDAIRYNATKFNASRNRAVTSEDYRSLIKANLSKAKDVAVWGGEENDPPVYGKVFISIHPNTGYVITDADKEYVRETILRPRSVMSIQHEFVNPEYLYIGFEGIVNYNPKLTTLSATDIASLAQTEIEDYFDEELGTLDKTFFLSKLTERVKLANTSIIGSLFKMRLQRRISIVTGTNYAGTINFLTAIDPETVRSSIFTTILNNVQYNAYLQDYSDDAIENEQGTGTLKLVNADNDVVITNVGTVNYTTGVVTISNVNINSYLGNETSLSITVRPQPLYQNVTSSQVRTADVSPYAIQAEASRNIILVLDDSESNTEAGITSGLIINALPYTEV